MGNERAVNQGRGRAREAARASWPGGGGGGVGEPRYTLALGPPPPTLALGAGPQGLGVPRADPEEDTPAPRARIGVNAWSPPGSLTVRTCRTFAALGGGEPGGGG